MTGAAESIGHPPGRVSPPDELGQALARVLASTSLDDVAETPSALRSRLVAELGDQGEHRGAVHRLVVAADERLPQMLSAAAPVDDAEIDRLARSLAATRGWSYEPARETVEQWATALGARSGSARAPAPDAVRTPLPVPPGPSTELPVQRPATPAVAEALPASSADVGPAILSRGPSAIDAGAPRAHHAWPSSSGSRMRKAREREQRDPGGVYRAFHPRSPMLLLVGAVVLLVLVVVVLVATKVLVGFVPLLLALLLGRLAVPEGQLVVDEDGGRFYRSLAPGATPVVEFTWADARVTPSMAPRIDTPQGPVWLWLGSRAVAQAAQSRTPGGAS